jgi:hypothetical protein
MNAYEEKVKKLFDERSSEIVANSSYKHAAILYEQMFLHAQKQVNILCRNIDPQVFDAPGVLSAVKIFLKQNNGKLNIAFQDENPMDSKFLDLILEEDYDKTNQVQIFKVGQLIVEEKTSANFATMDDNAYRFEPDREYCRAIASANNTNFVAKLNSFFQEMTGVSA